LIPAHLSDTNSVSLAEQRHSNLSVM